jgi:hypothetical protein
MTLTQEAEIVFDLRHAWEPLRSYAWASAGEEVEDGGAVVSTTAPDSPAGDEDEEHRDEGEVQDPDRQRLSREAARYRNTAKAERERADAAEAKAGTLKSTVRDLTAQVAFFRDAARTIDDLEAAWKLADRSALTLSDDGEVEGVDEVLASLIERYPYLKAKPAGDVDPGLTEKFPALIPSGRPTNGKRRNDEGVDVKALAKKFPALGRRR